MGLQGGDKTAEAVVSSSTVDSVSISGRLAESTSFVSSGEDKHGTASSTMPTSGSFSEREVQVDYLLGHRISGKETGFSARQGISVGYQKITDRGGPSRRSTKRRSARNKGGVTFGPVVNVVPNSSFRTSLPQTVLMGSDQGNSSQEKRLKTPVFYHFKDWGQLSDRDLTLMTVFLLALATGKRRSELHALSHDVRWIDAKYEQSSCLRCLIS